MWREARVEKERKWLKVRGVQGGQSQAVQEGGKFHLGKFCGRMSGSCCAGGWELAAAVPLCSELRGTLSAGSRASSLERARL